MFACSRKQQQSESTLSQADAAKKSVFSKLKIQIKRIMKNRSSKEFATDSKESELSCRYGHARKSDHLLSRDTTIETSTERCKICNSLCESDKKCENSIASFRCVTTEKIDDGDSSTRNHPTDMPSSCEDFLNSAERSYSSNMKNRQDADHEQISIDNESSTCETQYTTANPSEQPDLSANIYPTNCSIMPILKNLKYEDVVLSLARMMEGKWETIVALSDPLDPLFSVFGISYYKRYLFDKLAIPLTITLENKVLLQVLVHIPFGTRQMCWALDGTTSQEDDPDCGIWAGNIEIVNDFVHPRCSSVVAMKQVRRHASIGTVHETRCVVPDEKYGRLLLLYYEYNGSKKLRITRVLKPLD